MVPPIYPATDDARISQALSNWRQWSRQQPKLIRRLPGESHLNLLVSDIAGNARQVIDCAARVKGRADIVVFPELTLTGYPPEDLLLRPACDTRVAAALREIAAASHGISLVVGYPAMRDGVRYNVAGLVRDDIRQNVSGLPGLSKLPVLGTLFRSRDFVRNETELVIIVTPYLSRPVARNDLAKPDDNFTPASDGAGMFLGRVNRVYGLKNTNKPAGRYHGVVGFIYK